MTLVRPRVRLHGPLHTLPVWEPDASRWRVVARQNVDGIQVEPYLGTWDITGPDCDVIPGRPVLVTTIPRIWPWHRVDMWSARIGDRRWTDAAEGRARAMLVPEPRHEDRERDRWYQLLADYRARERRGRDADVRALEHAILTLGHRYGWDPARDLAGHAWADLERRATPWTVELDRRLSRLAIAALYRRPTTQTTHGPGR